MFNKESNGEMMDLDDIIAERILGELTEDAKNKIVLDYINKRIDVDSYAVRNKGEALVTKACTNALDERKQDIADAVNEALTETLENKNTISKWIIKRRLIAGAKYLLTQL